MLNDYHMNLVSVREIPDSELAKMQSDVIDVCVGIRALKEVIRFRRKKKEEECNMCQAIDDLVRISTNEGIEKGIVKGKSEAVVQLLEQHGAIPQETINKIISENNQEQLKHWLIIAASVKSVEEFCEAM